MKIIIGLMICIISLLTIIITLYIDTLNMEKDYQYSVCESLKSQPQHTWPYNENINCTSVN